MLLFPFLGHGCFQLPLPRCVVQPPGLSLALPAERCPLHLDSRQRREPGDAPVEGPVGPSEMLMSWDDPGAWQLELCCQRTVFDGYMSLEFGPEF